MLIYTDTLNNIGQYSFLYDTLVERIYGSFKETPLTIRIQRKLVDAKGCELYNTIDNLTYRYNTNIDNITWNWEYIRKWTSDYCCNGRRGLHIFSKNLLEENADGTIVRLVESPHNNYYNFEAVYSSDEKKWIVTRDSIENTALIESKLYDEDGVEIGMSGRMLEIKDFCLPSGKYNFEIEMTCGKIYKLGIVADFLDTYVMGLSEDIKYTEYQNCYGKYITYTNGKFRRDKYNTDKNTGLEQLVAYEDYDAKFKVVKGPTGGYQNREYYVNEEIRLTMPG